MALYDRANDIARGLIKTWVPEGHVERGTEWVAPAPQREDKNIGSFSINLQTGAFNDYADPDFCGKDFVSFYARLNGLRNSVAAQEILTKYDPSYFPTDKEFVEQTHDWYQLIKGAKNAPALPEKYKGVKQWPLEICIGKEWRTVMWICRHMQNEYNEDGKQKKCDYPYTLWTDGTTTEWRSGALKGAKYPLYNLRGIVDNPNARIVLYEGQKVPSVVQPVLGGDWVCAGWYGGAGNSALTDMSPLTGREIWYPFDADSAGRQAINKITEQVHAKLHLVYPPAGIKKGWDHADAVADGWTKEQIEAVLLADTVPAITEPEQVPSAVPDNRPSRMDLPMTAERKEEILSEITTHSVDKEGNTCIKWHSDWMYTVIEMDPAISNSIKYDYTTGIESTAYDNSNIYMGALEQRLIDIGIPVNLATDKVIKKMMRAVINRNSNFNKVADYIQSLASRYPNETEKTLDDFMALITFDIEEEPDRARKMYRELFDKFFVRMHAHINGTRKINGEYKGLIENDIVPILSGPQGCGKTTLCHWIACDDELYADLGSGLKQQFGSAETVKKVRGKLLVEIGEMKVMKNAESIETIKSFISQKSVSIDIKYVENQNQVPMTASFMGTDNEGQYLCDNTGNRRFWPVKIKSVNMDAMGEDLKFRLHAYYAKKTEHMTNAQVFEYCKPSEELNEFIEAQRKEALITYSDYEACCLTISAWKTSAANGTQLSQAEVERLAFQNQYMGRISQRSFRRACEDCGLVRKRVKSQLTGQMSYCWVKDDIPF